MSVQLIETGTHVFEVEITPDTPGVCDRTAVLRKLSGPPLTPDEMRRLQEAIVRDLIDAGCRVYRAGYEARDQ